MICTQHLMVMLGSSTVLLLMTQEVLASSSGPVFHCFSPLPRLLESLTSDVAIILMTYAVIGAGLLITFSEASGGLLRLLGVSFGGALALGMLTYIAAVGW